MKLDVGRASAMNAVFKLQSINLGSLRANLVPRGGESDPEALSWDLREVDIRWVPFAHEIRVICPFVVDLYVQVDGRKRHAAELGVVFRVDYNLAKDSEMPSDEDISHYVGVLGFMHAWPYLRADVQSLSTRLGFPGLTLPVMLSGQVPELARATKGLPTPPAAERRLKAMKAGTKVKTAKPRTKVKKKPD